MDSPVLHAARSLYERTIDPDERIPWSWIERTVADPALRQPTGWAKHLILASNGNNIHDPRNLLGYAYGAFIHGFGGYLCYVGVADHARQKGVGSQLFDFLTQTFAADAARAGEKFPFVVWESYRPAEDDPIAMHELWNARARTFGRAGGFWVDGVELATPNFNDDDPLAMVPLQLFLKPVDEPLNRFTSERLVEITCDLMKHVYHETPGDWFYDRTMDSIHQPRLRPALDSTLVRV